MFDIHRSAYKARQTLSIPLFARGGAAIRPSFSIFDCRVLIYACSLWSVVSGLTFGTAFGTATGEDGFFALYLLSS